MSLSIIPEVRGSLGFLGAGGVDDIGFSPPPGGDILTVVVFLRVFTVSHFDAMMIESRRDFCPSVDGGVGSDIERKKEYL
jgi:hypothetical protein